MTFWRRFRNQTWKIKIVWKVPQIRKLVRIHHKLFASCVSSGKNIILRLLSPWNIRISPFWTKFKGFGSKLRIFKAKMKMSTAYWDKLSNLIWMKLETRSKRKVNRKSKKIWTKNMTNRPKPLKLSQKPSLRKKITPLVRERLNGGFRISLKWCWSSDSSHKRLSIRLWEYESCISWYVYALCAYQFEFS